MNLIMSSVNTPSTMIAKTANVQKYCGLNKDDLMNPNALRMVVLRAMREK